MTEEEEEEEEEVTKKDSVRKSIKIRSCRKQALHILRHCE